MAPNGDGVTTTLGAKIVEETGSTFTIVVRDVTGGVARMAGVEEGTQPGQLSIASGLTNTASKALRQSLASIAGEGGAVGSAADAVIAMLTGNGRGSIAQDLLSVASNTGQSSGNRINALILLAMIVADERDR